MAAGSDRSRSKLYLKITVVFIAAAVVVVLLLRGVDWRAWLGEGKTAILRAGPAAFFGAMALLPVPMLPFYVTASAFKSVLGLGGVLAATAGAIAVNITLAYWLARRWLRPWLEKLVTRRGHRIPQVSPADRFEVTMLVRIVPGPPFYVQSCLLGLAEIPFRIYFLVSWVIATVIAAAVIVFSDALLQGRGREALFGGSLLVAVVLAVHLLRKHYGKKKKASAA